MVNSIRAELVNFWLAPKHSIDVVPSGSATTAIRPCVITSNGPLSSLPPKPATFAATASTVVHLEIHALMRRYIRDRVGRGDWYAIAQKHGVVLIRTDGAVGRCPAEKGGIKYFGGRLILRRQFKLTGCSVRHFSFFLRLLRVHRWTAPEFPVAACTPTIVPGDAPGDSSPSRVTPRFAA